MAHFHFTGIGLALTASMLALGFGASAGRAAEAAQDWRLVNWSDEAVLYIDHARLKLQGRSVKYWAKVVYLKDPAYSEILSEVQINCSEQSFRNLSIAGYYHGGLVHRETAKLDWQPVTKGTNIEREMQHVCKTF
jgi:hypothetical protein